MIKFTELVRKTIRNRLVLHVAFWVAYNVFFFFYMYSVVEMTLRLTLASLITFGSVVMMTSYFTMYVLIEQFLYRKKYVGSLFLFAGSALFFVLLLQSLFQFVVIPTFFPDAQGTNYFDPGYCYYQFVQIYVIVALTSIIKIVRKWQRDQAQKAELERQNLNSEIALLRSQINPHFLFNTINNIDTLIHVNPEKASRSLIKLSEIMRYMLYESNTSRVSLEKELEYIQSLVDLQQLRVREEEYIVLSISCENKNLTIAPMLFVPYIENAFKHGDKNITKSGIKISNQTIDRKIVFEVDNFYRPDLNYVKDKVGGIGLGIAKRRLELIYPNQYSLDITKTENQYKVRLVINT